MPGDGEIGNLSGYIGDAIRQGLSQNKTEALLRAPRSEGGAGVRGSHAALRGEIQRVQQHLLAHPDVASLPHDSPIDASQYKAWNARGRGAFVHQVEIGQYSAATGGIVKLQWTVRSDTPLSPAEAEQRAVDEAEDGAAENPGGENVRVLGGNLTGTHYATGASRIDPLG